MREKLKAARKAAGMTQRQMADNTHYKNGFRKWSAFPLSSRIVFIVSLISLAVALYVHLSR